MTTMDKGEDISGSDLEIFEMPETVLCVDTICNICYAEFLDEDDLKVHVKQMHLTEQSRSRYCQFCSTMFPSLEEYARHISEVHILNLKCCKYCMRTFSHLPDVRKHERKHLSSAHKSGYSCSNCNRVFNSVTELEDHEYSIHSNGKDGVLLQECYSLLSSFLNMKASTFLQSLGTHYKYTCVCCKISTHDVEYYMQHLQQKNCRSLVCDKCCSVFRKRMGLKRHFMNHYECHNKVHEDLKLPCERCNNTFNFDLLQEHIKTCQAVKCTSCNIVFDNVSDRANHQAETHRTMFSIKICKYCHREFVGKVALGKHIERSHRKDLHLYKYFCIYCEDIFNHPKKLFSHFFGKHKDLKPYTCKICNKTFKLRKQFTLHIKLEHSSRGTVKFDDNFHVLFTDDVPPSSDKDTIEEDDTTNQNTLDSSRMVIENAEPDSELNKESMSVLGDVELVMCPTETEVEQTDADKVTAERVKRKRRVKTKTPAAFVDLTVPSDCTDGESDNEPLVKVRRRMRARLLEDICIPTWLEKSKEMKRNRRKFTCKICKKYCYTYQNYNHHMSLHQRYQYKRCIKCPKVFKSKERLSNHILKEHSTSKLTETLKSVRERRKRSHHQLEYPKASELSRQVITQRFLKTIKKVSTDGDHVPVKVTPVINKLSAKKFIENFTPESSDNGTRRCVQLDNVVTIKRVSGPIRSSTIKLVRASDTSSEFVRLRQPVRYRDSFAEQYTVTVKLVTSTDPPKMNFDELVNAADDYQEAAAGFADEDPTAIPDVAEEILLEETAEAPKPKEVLHKLIIPKLPVEYKDIHIAHLLPEAPYYKIVKIDQVLKEQTVKVETRGTGDIKLPDGTKLVSVNPLAHLIGDKTVELPKNKYYKPKQVDIGKALMKALLKSKQAPAARRPRKPDFEAEQ